MSIFKTGNSYWNNNVFALCDVYYDRSKIDIPCDESRGVPSAVPSVSSIPTSSSAPTLPPDCSCAAGEFKFELELKTDYYPSETSWKIQSASGDILATDENAYNEQFQIFNHEYCLPVGCYDFVIDDGYGDGICCFEGDGYFKGNAYGWKEVFDGGEFKLNATESFCGVDVCPFATHYPSSSPSASSRPSISPSLVSSTSPSVSLIPTSTSAPSTCSCGVGEFKFELELKTDIFPEETSWKIQNENGHILYNETYTGFEALEIFNHEYCLPVGCYNFTIDDSFGDGICCLNNYYDDESFDYYFDDGFFDYYGIEGVDDLDNTEGYYKGSVFGWKEVFDGGNFQFNATESFCGEDVCSFSTHYPSTSPSTSSRPSILPSLTPSSLPSASPQPSFMNDNEIIPIPKTPFYIYTTYMSWNDCKIAAENSGYTFASIHKQPENDDIFEYLSNNGIWSVWLGGYQTSSEDEPAGNWAWVDGTPWADSTYTNWAPGEPNNWNNNENHLCLRSWDGKWRDCPKEWFFQCLFRDPT